MLIQFSFKNYGPFREEAVFDMRAINTYKEHPYNLIDIDDKLKVIKVAAIYGANASGKSNFVEAFSCFFKIVTTSFNNKEENKKSILSTQYNPFIFSSNDDDAKTEFEVIHIIDGDEYKYGFIYNEKEILYEWLYKKSLSTGRKSMIIERSKNKIDLGSSVKKSCQNYAAQIEKDVLALSFFNRLRLRTTVFKVAYYCVTSVLALEFTRNISTKDILQMYFKDDFNKDKKIQLLRFLSSIDIGIKDITVSKNKDNIQVFSHHIGDEGKDYIVPIDIESDGTLKVIALYFCVSIAIKYNKGLIIDELNMQLHPLLLKFIIDLFYSENTKGQLIYTTHDTTLLDKRYFRRDQVWFAEKDKLGQAKLYSLAEFKVRNDTSFEKDYLSGLFGGIPILNDFAMEDSFDGNR